MSNEFSVQEIFSILRRKEKLQLLDALVDWVKIEMPNLDPVLNGPLVRRLFNVMAEGKSDVMMSLCRTHQGEEEADTIVLNSSEKQMILDCDTLSTTVQSVRNRYGCALKSALDAVKKYQKQVKENATE